MAEQFKKTWARSKEKKDAQFHFRGRTYDTATGEPSKKSDPENGQRKVDAVSTMVARKDAAKKGEKYAYVEEESSAIYGLNRKPEERVHNTSDGSYRGNVDKGNDFDKVVNELAKGEPTDTLPAKARDGMKRKK